MNELEKATIICNVVAGLKEKGWVGKTHIQKSILFVQDACGIDLDFNYVIYHYGPYSFELNGLMERMEKEGLLNIERSSDGYGFQVDIGEVSTASTLDSRTASKLRILTDRLGGMSASQMELVGTAFYVEHRFKDDFTSNAERVKSLKPRFSDSAIKKAIEDSVEITKALQISYS